MNTSEAYRWVVIGTAVGVLLFAYDIAMWFLPFERIPLPWAIGYVPEFLAGIIGVLVGFLLAQSSEKKKKGERIPQLKSIVESELRRIAEVCSDITAAHLPNQAWTSLVNSGDSALLPFDLQEELFAIYAMVQDLNIQHARERSERFEHKNR